MADAAGLPLGPQDAAVLAARAAIFDDHAPQPGWFAGRANGAHGYGHAARVLFWADALGRLLQADGVEVDLQVVRWAAVLHDSRRVSEASDPAHGRRAAAWARESNQSPLWRLSPAAREAVSYCCEWHVPPDHEAPEMTPELTCLKDADSLDRVRFGSLQRRYLRTHHAHRLATAADTLCDVTRTSLLDGQLQWIAVQAAGWQLLTTGAAADRAWSRDGCCFSC